MGKRNKMFALAHDGGGGGSEKTSLDREKKILWKRFEI